MTRVRLLWLFLLASMACAWAAMAQDPMPAPPVLPISDDHAAPAQMIRAAIILGLPMLIALVKRYIPPAYLPYLATAGGVALQLGADILTGGASSLVSLGTTGIASIGVRETVKQSQKLVDGTAKTVAPATIEAKGGPTVEEQARVEAKQ